MSFLRQFVPLTFFSSSKYRGLSLMHSPPALLRSIHQRKHIHIHDLNAHQGVPSTLRHSRQLPWVPNFADNFLWVTLHDITVIENAKFETYIICKKKDFFRFELTHRQITQKLKHWFDTKPLHSVSWHVIDKLFFSWNQLKFHILTRLVIFKVSL